MTRAPRLLPLFAVLALLAAPAAVGAERSLPERHGRLLPTADGEPVRIGSGTRSPTVSLPGPLPCVELDGLDDRCEAWTAAHDAEATGAAPLQFPADIVLSPDDATVFVAMEEQDGQDPWTAPSIWVIAAHEAATGEQRWRVEIEGLRAQSFPSGVAVAPDGGTLYVAGSDREAFGGGESATVVVALDPETGAERWRRSFDGPGGIDNPRTLAADGSGVYVAVISANGDNGDLDYVLWALDPSGEERFATRWSGIGDGRVDTPLDIGVAPDGGMAYLTGWSAGAGEFNVDYGTVAFLTRGEDAGRIAWEARYDGEGGRGPDQAYGLEVDADRVYVTGYSNDLDAGSPFAVNYEFATVAYDAATGAPAWEARRVWDEDNWSPATEIALDGGRVFVAGQTSGGGDSDYATQALDAETGAEVWTDRYELEGHDFEAPLAIAAGGGGVYVTGISSSSATSTLFLGAGQLADQATVAYEAPTGERSWIARHNDSGYDDDAGVAIEVTGDGRVVTLAQLVRNVQADGDFYDVGLASYGP